MSFPFPPRSSIQAASSPRSCDREDSVNTSVPVCRSYTHDPPDSRGPHPDARHRDRDRDTHRDSDRDKPPRPTQRKRKERECLEKEREAGAAGGRGEGREGGGQRSRVARVSQSSSASDLEGEGEHVGNATTRPKPVASPPVPILPVPFVPSFPPVSTVSTSRSRGSVSSGYSGYSGFSGYGFSGRGGFRGQRLEGYGGVRSSFPHSHSRTSHSHSHQRQSRDLGQDQSRDLYTRRGRGDRDSSDRGRSDRGRSDRGRSDRGGDGDIRRSRSRDGGGDGGDRGGDRHGSRGGSGSGSKGLGKESYSRRSHSDPSPPRACTRPSLSPPRRYTHNRGVRGNLGVRPPRSPHAHSRSPAYTLPHHAHTHSRSPYTLPHFSDLLLEWSLLQFSDLPLEWWERSDECKAAKAAHTERVDSMEGSREDLVMATTLLEADTVLEPNMFPYETPPFVEHWTLWSLSDLSHGQVVRFVDCWLRAHMPQARRWAYDDNLGERSIALFHVHVFVETRPYAFEANPLLLYVPPHAETHAQGQARLAAEAEAQMQMQMQMQEDQDQQQQDQQQDQRQDKEVEAHWECGAEVRTAYEAEVMAGEAGSVSPPC